MQTPQLPADPPPAESARQIVSRAVRQPAWQVYIALWLMAAVILALNNLSVQLLNAAVMTVILAILSLLTLVVTRGKGGDEPRGGLRPGWGQLAVLAFFVGLTALGGLSFHGMLPGGVTRVPIWSQLVQVADSFGLPSFTFLVNPLLLFVMPFVALWLLGARPGELGFRTGWRPWTVTAIWMVPGLLVLAGGVLTGQPPCLLRLLGRLGSNAVQNGLMEEFLFRGALQTRLTRLWNGDWGLVLSSLLFGVWHLGLTTKMAGGNYLVGAALAIVNQGTMGLGFGLIFRRTGSLLAPSLVHCWFNSV